MGELIEGDFDNPARKALLTESTGPPAESSLAGLSEDQLIKAAMNREVRLAEANRRMQAGEISFDELFEALAATITISRFLTEEQHTAAFVSAQAIYEDHHHAQ